MYGNAIYVPRSLYGKREEMLSEYADLVAGKILRKVIVINEGAGDIARLLGFVRLVEYLSLKIVYLGKNSP
ncbi:hypothetical protein MKX01_040371 [Papaver californicum]|nr:hypothetical protein MKX01_040371 [Papaver californicum]